MAEDNSAGVSGFTAGETKLLMSMMKNLQGEFPTDFDAVAGECGYKDGSVAKQRWNQIRRKKIRDSAPAGSVDKSSPAKKNTKAKKATAENEGEDEEPKSPIKTPAKKGRGRPKKVKEEPVDEDGDEQTAAIETTEKAEEDGADELAT